ncbi:MAG: ATP phosphoribosyltransferase regulatory subunit [Candidatus Avoscillospira sp.]
MEALFKQDEKAVYALRKLYQSYGYSQFKMSQFEAYDLYAKNKDFLVSEGVITFTDTDGTLMALKPDVTLSIVKNYRVEPSCVQKVYYNENVYRIAGASHCYREIMQTGLECLGHVGLYERSEVILLAVQSLQTISGKFVLNLSHLAIVKDVLDSLPMSDTERAAVLRCIGEKNEDGLQSICGAVSDLQLSQLLGLIRIHAPICLALEQMSMFTKTDALRELQTLAEILKQAGVADHVYLDFSIVSDQNYYNGLVFRGYVEGIPASVLSGGQYDRLMRKMGKNAGGIGFAVYLDQLERLDGGRKPYDVDTVLTYESGCDISLLLHEADQLRQEGRQVLVVQALPAKLQYRRLFSCKDGRIELLEDNG